MNKNADKKGGATIKAIEDPSVIARIRSNLKSNPRNLLLFDLATQTGLKMRIILQLKVKDLLNINIGEAFGPETVNKNVPPTAVMTETLYETFQMYLRTAKSKEEDYLIRSQKGNRPLMLSTVSQMVRGWLESVGLQNQGGAKSLRKTWQYHYQSKNNSDVQHPKHTTGGYALAPVKNQTIQDKVYHQILNAILTGKIRPGQRLVISHLTQQLHVSPAPIRETIRRLEAMGMITPPQKKGCLVKELSKENLEEISRIRLWLELKAGEKATQRCPEDHIDHLAALNRAYIAAVEKNTADQIFSANQMFHFSLYQEAGMPILLETIRGLWNRMSPYLHILFRIVKTYDITHSTTYHRQIINALRCRDAGKLKDALMKDLEVGRVNLIQYFDQVAQSFP